MQYPGGRDAYAAFGVQPSGPSPYGSVLSSWKGKGPSRRRMNIIPICLCVFLPWLTFCLIFAMMSFDMHYRQPGLCLALLIVGLVVFALALTGDLAWIWWRKRSGEAPLAGSGSWLLFLTTSCLMAVVAGWVFGNHNFWQTSEVYYDIMALNSYNAVDPAHMRGQELMDAGRVLFVPGTHLDLRRSMGFKNFDTYCVAPITAGGTVGDAPLASYDFWAVGKDCCSSSAVGGDFQCGAFDNPKARGGLRMMRDEERAFYRLAVQQAESAFQIKATHPLFFHWVEDPVESTYQHQRNAYQMYFVGMCTYFLFQMFTVFTAATCFLKCSGGVA